jgi:AcrR family transcriptional regulator
MSGKSKRARPKKRLKKEDQRVRRTRNALGDALIMLMQEKNFEDITVQQVLDCAGVGRSTFYKHFQDKDDLFLSDLEDFFEMFSSLLIQRKEPSKRVVAVRELFAHVGENRSLHSALAAADKLQDFQEMAQEYFARAITKRLQQLTSPRPTSTEWTANGQALAGALLSLMTWWLRSGSTASPEEMDDLYHRMVWAGVSPVSGAPGVEERTPARALARTAPTRRTTPNQKAGKTSLRA